ncbi:MAG: polysaccharide deacetylase family protein, partial [Candidatus Omnitrophica bacterium]|nr:polysaccharide deacetylase family protein [Candidatus Omnitrophota bacterium]
KRILEQELGVPIDHFTYPIGGFNREIQEIVKKAGYQSACTTNRGYERSNKDLYALRRIRLSNDNTSDFLLRVKLSGYYNLTRKLKFPH